MPNTNKEIWICHYNLSNGVYGVALGYANTREDFSQHMSLYCQASGVSETHQLAPLPLRTWITRHGMSWDYWHFAEQLSEHNPFVFIPKQTLEEPHTPIAQQSYLIEHQQTINELGEQFGHRFPLAVPSVLNDSKQNGFFAQMDWYADYLDEESAPKMDRFEDMECPNYYLVIDAKQSFFFPTDFIDNLPSECLYKGKSYESASDIAPYLVQLQVGDSDSRSFVQRLFTQHENTMFGYWDINPAIFIRSHQDFDSVFNHLRKFTHLFGENSYGEEKWYFFRFYDPEILAPYLRGIANYPNHLMAFFGVKSDENRIIESFGARVDEQFYRFAPEPLPEGTISAKIEYGELEKEIFKQFEQDKFFRNQVVTAIPSEFPKQHFSEEQLRSYFDNVTKLDFKREGSLIYLVKTQCYLANSDYDIQQLFQMIEQEYGKLSETDFSLEVYRKAIQLAGKHNDRH